MRILPAPIGLLSALAACALTTGCGLFDYNPVDAGDDAPVAHGFGKPTLEVTIGSVHFGPTAPDSSSGAQLFSTRDERGRLLQSSFSLAASITAAGAGCFFSATRENPDGTTPIGAGAFRIASDMTGVTPDGTAAPGGTESAVVPEAQLSCSGSACDGGALAITVLDASHVEGTIAGNWADSAGRGLASVVCAFYLPVTAYQP